VSSFRTVKRKGCQKPKISREKRIKRNWIPERMSTEKCLQTERWHQKGCQEKGMSRKLKQTMVLAMWFRSDRLSLVRIGVPLLETSATQLAQALLVRSQKKWYSNIIM